MSYRITQIVANIYGKLYDKFQVKLNQQIYSKYFYQQIINRAIGAITKQEKIRLPLFQRDNERQEIEFFFSNKVDEFGYQQNPQNILFCVGAEGNGKTWLIKQSTKNLQISLNLEQCYSFEHFVNELTEGIIQKISNNPNLSVEILEKLILSGNDPNYLNQYFNKALELFRTGQIDFLHNNNNTIEQIILYRLEQQQKQLEVAMKIEQELSQQILSNDDEEHVPSQNFTRSLDFQTNFKNMVNIMGKEHFNSNEQAIRFMLVIINLIEQDINQKNVVKINFLFDIMNYLSGIIDENGQIQSKLVDTRPITPYGLALCNWDSLNRKYPYKKEIYDFMDHIILRLYNRRGIRSHFPILVESSDSAYFNRDIFEMLSVDVDSFSTVDVHDFSRTEIENHTSQIFNIEQFEKIHQVMGSNPQDLQLLIKRYVQEENFDINQYLQKISNIKDNPEYNKFESLINQTYVNIECAKNLDNGDLDKQIIEVMQLFIKFNGTLWTGRHYQDVFLQNPVIIAFQKLGIISHGRYRSELQVSKKSYIIFMNLYVTQKIKLQKSSESYIQRSKNQLHYLNPFQDTVLNTDYFYPSPKQRKINLIHDYDEPREREERSDGKGLRPFHLFLAR